MVKLAVEDVDRFRTMPTESEHLEFKEAKNTYDTDKLKEYCVALSNEGGGFLVLGVADVPPRRVVGTKAFPKPAELGNVLLQACGFRVDIQEIAHPDGRILVFVIPGRPSGIAYELEGKYLMRAGSSLVGMSADRLRQIFGEGGPHWGAEPCTDALSAQQILPLLDTEAFFSLLNMAHPTSAEAIIDRIHRHRLLTPSGGKYRILRMGAPDFETRRPDLGTLSPVVAIRYARPTGRGRVTRRGAASARPRGAWAAVARRASRVAQ